MLKIKDNVDLKQLEKFGFEYYYEDERGYWFKYYFTKPSDTSEITITIDEGDNKIIIKADYNANLSFIDFVYDLIKADLVEKME